MDINPIEQIRKKRHEVVALLPPPGATREEIKEALAKLTTSYFMPLLFALVASSLLLIVQHVHLGLDLDKPLVIMMNMGFASLFVLWSHMYVTWRKEEADLVAQLCLECDDPVLLNQVTQLADLPDTQRWLHRLINDSKRDYLCWYEVFLVVDLKGKDELVQQQKTTAKNELLDAIKK